MKRKSKYDRDINTTVGAAAPDALSEFETLGTEMRDWYDSMPEQFQSGDKGNAVEEAASTLENIPLDIDVPAAISELPVQYTERQDKTSRAARRDYAVMLLSMAISAAQEWYDDEANAKHAEYDDVGTFIEEAQQAQEEAEGVDFPGMMG
jgi:hypothetical protein